ncbi:SIMPL domain-containing protein [Thalassorhabdomicrobium marinisediminis]|uniref:SIMPL domain-containing protein n=1 Tax=Thalassorhabdomicrobium marinisediminis TaxID=2170577 RepID=UPI00248FBAB4|nr:SIMPL domain-containing protein [Thalassorhabdomicrobium marinisediminis]
MRSTLAIGALAATLLSATLATPLAADAPARTITVTGTGEVSVDPDMATVMIGVQTESEHAAEALDAASVATSSLLSLLEAEGIPPEQIRSSTIRLQPRYSSSALSSGTEITGYQAVNSIMVEVMSLDRLGGLLAASVGEGANRLNGVTFGLQDPDEATDEARRLAVADARCRAELYADAAGVSLDGLVSLSEMGGGSYRPMRAEPVMLEMANSAPQHDVPTAPGQIDVSASVNMVFAIDADDDED